MLLTMLHTPSIKTGFCFCKCQGICFYNFCDYTPLWGKKEHFQRRKKLFSKYLTSPQEIDFSDNGLYFLKIDCFRRVEH